VLCLSFNIRIRISILPTTVPELIEMDSPAIPSVKCAFSTLAVAPMTTGNSGDLFATAFDKMTSRAHSLACSSWRETDDMAAATELIRNPAVSDAMDLFPCLMRRCGANIDKRIHNLHILSKIESSATTFGAGGVGYEPGLTLPLSFQVRARFLGNMEMRCLRLRSRRHIF
jgi:hypothetical protein